MRITVDEIEYQTAYFPFAQKKDGWYLQLPSGKDYYAFQEYNHDEAESILKFHIKEYMLEDDENLSGDAKDLKYDLMGMIQKVEKHPCIKCEKELSLFDVMHPNDGVVFRARGNYGSTVFDPMDGSYLEVLICDDCLIKHKSKFGGNGVIEK